MPINLNPITPGKKPWGGDMDANLKIIVDGVNANEANLIVATQDIAKLGRDIATIGSRSGNNFDIIASGDKQLKITDPDGAPHLIDETALESGGAFVVGKNYYVFSIDGNIFKISTNKEYNPGLIGGFHFGVLRRSNARLQPINASGIVRGTGWESNVYDCILPRSVWTHTHRPRCAPEGMVYLGFGTWIDIYHFSDDAVTGTNSNHGVVPITGTEKYNWYTFEEHLMALGKRHQHKAEFLAAAIGSPQGQNGNNDNAWAMTTNTGRTTSDNVRNAVSSIGCRHCVGNVWEWTDEFNQMASGRVLMGTTNPTSYTYGDGDRAGKIVTNGTGHGPTTRGDSGAPVAGAWGWDRESPWGDGYGNIYEYYDQSLVALICGGDWHAGVNAGARSVYLNNSPWYFSTSIGARGCCASL